MSACRACTSRGLLLRVLAAHIDRAVDGRAGARARDLLALDDAALAAAACPAGWETLLERARSAELHSSLGRDLERSGCWSVCPHVPGFPAGLEALGGSAPRAIFGAGDAALLGSSRPEGSVTIVGSRRCGAYGREVASELGRLLAGSDVKVISGLALGVDSAAHEGALEGASTPVAVLGTGPDRPYPRSHRRLFERIRSTGVVLSELPPGTSTFRWLFPARNRLMAALAGITVVVEAAERSGSLITAEMAIEIGRQVGAVPGPVTSWRSAGANRLLVDGAAVIRDAQDVLDCLLGPGVAEARRYGPELEAGDRAVLDAIEAGASTVDSILAHAGGGFGRCLAALGRLERGGYVAGDATGALSRTSLRRPPRARDPADARG